MFRHLQRERSVYIKKKKGGLFDAYQIARVIFEERMEFIAHDLVQNVFDFINVHLFAI
jgi:uncharacterized Fe-S cluster-containing MiaB family protein